MSKNDWIAHRQERSEVPWKTILATGYDAIPCDCQLKGCLGWRVALVATALPTAFRSDHPEQAA